MAQVPPPSLSIVRKRWRKFRSLKRGYYSFLVILMAYLVSFVLPLLVSNQPLVVRFEGEFYFPKLRFHSPADFGLEAIGEPDYREVKEKFAAEGEGNWVLLPPYPYSPSESLLELEGSPPHAPSLEHPMGTDDRGRDVFARLAYGFNISMTFALLVLFLSFALGITVGGLIGYFGGKLDILGQRVIEIWSSLPFLYTIMIVSSIVVP
ncbi:MAG: ABC transporter permease, partial [Candidatus Bipolaricaulota bacterium]